MKIDIDCPHFKMCSGCSLAEGVAAPPLLLEAREFFAARGLPYPNLYVGDFLAWRCRAKLPIRGTAREPLIGLYRAHSHAVVPIPQCRIHHPAINLAVEKLSRWIRTENLPPFDESTGTGLLRYVQAVVERSSGKVQLSLVLHASGDVGVWKKQLAALWQAGDHLWHSLWINFNMRRDNVIFGPEWHLCCGSPLLWENLAGVDVCFQPANFAQANLDVFEKMLLAIRAAVPRGASVAELYAGVGAIGLSLAASCRKVSCSELNPAGLFCFEQARARLPAQIQARISWQQGDAACLSQQLIGADVAIVDPPRTGLHPALRQAMSNMPSLKRLIYVSCGWNAFARDCIHLLAEGWCLKQGEHYLLFPGSNHIETLAIFEKME